MKQFNFSSKFLKFNCNSIKFIKDRFEPNRTGFKPLLEVLRFVHTYMDCLNIQPNLQLGFLALQFKTPRRTHSSLILPSSCFFAIGRILSPDRCFMHGRRLFSQCRVSASLLPHRLSIPLYSSCSTMAYLASVCLWVCLVLFAAR